MKKKSVIKCEGKDLTQLTWLSRQKHQNDEVAFPQFKNVRGRVR